MALVLGWADFDTQTATRTILNRDLQAVEGVGQFFPHRGSAFEIFGRILELCRFVNLGSNHGMWADQHALPALNAEVGFPDGHKIGDAAFFMLGGATRVGAVNRHGADRQRISMPCDHHPKHVANKIWRIVWHGRNHGNLTRGCAWDFYATQVLERRIHGFKVLFDHRLAALAIGFLNRFLDFGNRLIFG